MNVTYKDILGWKDWSLNAGVYAAQGKSDIDFYNSNIVLAITGVAYTF